MALDSRTEGQRQYEKWHWTGRKDTDRLRNGIGEKDKDRLRNGIGQKDRDRLRNGV